MEDTADHRRRRKPLTYAIVTADIWDNPKIYKAGPFGAFVFVFALTRNAAHGRMGVFPSSEFEPWYIARRTALDLEQATAGRTQAIAAQLVAEAGDQIEVVGWSEEWKRADLTAAETERKRLYRLKISTTARPQISEEEKETRVEKNRVEQTGQSQKSPGHVPDKSGTTEGKPAKRATPILDGWVPSRLEGNIRAETEAKAAGVVLRTELESMRDWAKSQGKTRKDWDAQWRNWLRESTRRARGRPTANPARTGISQTLLSIARGEVP